jgi:hypothetical protein
MNFVEYFKKNWGILSALALFIVGILSTFLIEPESYIVSEKTFSNWGKFVAAIVIGLVLVAVIIFKSRHHTVKWWFTAASMLLLSVVSFFTYQFLRQKWTCICFNDNDPILIGSTLRNPDNDFIKENRDNCQVLLQGGACKADMVWTKDSRDTNRLILAGMYTVSLPFLITAMMAVVQALFCAQRRE